MKLKTILYILFSILTFVILFISSVVFSELVSDSVQNDKSNIASLKLNQIKNGLSTHFEYLESYLNLIVGSDDVKDILFQHSINEFRNRSNDPVWRFIRTNIMSPLVDHSNGTIDLLYYCSTKHGQNYSSNDTSYVDGRTRVWYKNAEKNTIFNYSSYLSFDNQRIDVTISKAIKRNTTLLGVVAVDINTQYIFSDLQNTIIDSNYIAIAIDTTGRIIFHPDKRYLLKSIYNPADSIPNEITQTIETLFSETGTKRDLFTLDSKEYLFHSNAIERNGWRVALGMDHAIIKSEINKKISFIILIDIIIFIVILILINPFIDKIIEPLNNLTSQMELIANGSYQDLSQIKLTTTYEINRLIHWFNTFVDSIKEIMRKKDKVSDTFSFYGQLVSEKVNDLNKQLVSQTHVIDKTSNSINSLKDQADILYWKTNSINKAIGLQRNVINESVSDIQIFKNVMSGITKQSQQMSYNLTDLARKIEYITSVMKILRNINSKINIIGFNASLESHASGEYGQRFKQVAMEIRRLSESIEDSIEDVSSIIDEIQQYSKSIVIESEKSTTQIIDGGHKSAFIIDKMLNMNKNFDQTLNTIVEISSLLENQSKSIETIVRSESEINISIHEINQIRNELTSLSNELYNLSHLEKAG